MKEAEARCEKCNKPLCTARLFVISGDRRVKSSSASYADGLTTAKRLRLRFTSCLQRKRSYWFSWRDSHRL